MIRKFLDKDLERIMTIWLNANRQVHDFIPEAYWEDRLEMVKSILPKAEVYVFEIDNQIEGFIGLDNGYIAGIFVSEKMQSNGIGRALIQKGKQLYKKLFLSVYVKNTKAVNFYLHENFMIQREQTDPDTGEEEYFMIWSK